MTSPIEIKNDFWSKDMDKEFYNQRRDRFADCVGEYLTCDSTDARQCYEEMLAEIDGWIDYHKKYMDKAVKLKELMMGHREVNLEFLTESIPDRY